MIQPILTIMLIYTILIVSFYLYFLNPKFKNLNLTFKSASLIKDKEFILFKFSLDRFYYTSSIILFYFIFENNGLNYLIEFNPYFIFILFIILFCYSILLSNIFNLNLFRLYLGIKNFIYLLNSINLLQYSFNYSRVNKFSLDGQKRNYSTLNKNNEKESSELKLNLDNESYSDLESDKTEFNLIKEQAISKFKKTYGGGFLGYTLIHSLGSVSYLINSESANFIEIYIKFLVPKIKIYLNEIPENVTYSILPVLRREQENGKFKTVTTTKSIKITRFTSCDLLAKRIVHSLLNILLIYNIKDNDIELLIIGRPWLDADDFNVSMSEITRVMDSQIEKEFTSPETSLRLGNKIYSNKAFKLHSYEYDTVHMDDYGDPVLDKNNLLIGYKINESEYVTIETGYNENFQIYNKVSVKEYKEVNLTLKDETINSWVDTRTEKGFVRELGVNKYFYDKFNRITNVKVSFNYNQFPLHKKDLELNVKIGTLDFETYGFNLGLGHHKVYAAGLATKDKTDLYYIEQGETSEQFVNRFFWNIFINNNLNGYTIYAHNLGRFDSIFIIKSLIKNENISLTPIWKDDTILSLTIKHLDKKIVLLDSLQLIPGSLKDILESFNCKITKTKFPYSVVNKKTLFYKGKKPSVNFYKDISDQEYLTIPENNWDLKKETLKYLKSDVEGLLEAILKFNDNIFNKYQLNITKFKTLPSLALAAYTSSYIPKILISEFKVIKGDLETEIRSSYFGGNVDVFINEINKGYLYDMNSQYPKAMLNDMPVGDPVLSLEYDLDKIFGFVYGEIYCPDEQTLLVPFIQHKDPLWKINSCPRGSFKRLIFSEEIRYALKFGYKIDIEYCYQFERGKDLFKNYVNDHYEMKRNSKDPIQILISKLFLNSLYGRMGVKDIDNNMKIISKKEVNNLDKNTNISIIS